MQGVLLAAAERIEHLEREVAVLAKITTYALCYDQGRGGKIKTRVFVNAGDVVEAIMDFGAIRDEDCEAVARGEDNAVDEDEYEWRDLILARQTAAAVRHVRKGNEGTATVDDNSGGPFVIMFVKTTVHSLLASDPPVNS